MIVLAKGCFDRSSKDALKDRRSLEVTPSRLVFTTEGLPTVIIPVVFPYPFRPFIAIDWKPLLWYYSTILDKKRMYAHYGYILPSLIPEVVYEHRNDLSCRNHIDLIVGKYKARNLWWLSIVKTRYKGVEYLYFQNMDANCFMMTQYKIQGESV